jgi:hypothetical protein
MEFLSEEVDGALIAEKKTESALILLTKSHQQRPFTLVITAKIGLKDRHKDEPFCVLRGKWSLGPRMQDDVCDRSQRET